jgi:hypothetical protein
VILDWCVACVSEIVCAFDWSEAAEKLTDCDADRFNGVRGGLAQEMRELGEDLSDRMQVQRIFRKNGLAPAARMSRGGPCIYACKIVHDVARSNSQVFAAEGVRCGAPLPVAGWITPAFMT